MRNLLIPRAPELESVKAALRTSQPYPVVFIMGDGETLCGKCVRSEWRQIVWATKTGQRDGWNIAGADVHWEGEPLQCAHCGAGTESAYGIPDAQEGTAHE